MQIHNSKVEKILRGFRTQYDIRKSGGEAQDEDDTKEGSENDAETKLIVNGLEQKPKDLKSIKAAAKKKGLKKIKKKEVGVVIQMKGEDGSLTTYNEESKGADGDSDAEEKENKKKTKKKTAKPKIESEETLEMLKQVLRPKKAKNNKETANDVQIIDEERSDEDSKAKTVKTKTVSKVVKKTAST